MLLAGGADAAKAKHDGRTPLHMLAQPTAGSDEAGGFVQALLRCVDDEEAVLEARDCNGLSPLLAACHFGNVEVATALIEAGADVDATATVHGSTPLMLTLAGESEGEVQRSLLELLLDADASVPGPADARGLTALDHAEECGRPELASLLQKRVLACS